jgi:CheY-like chemotaxis protein
MNSAITVLVVEDEPLIQMFIQDALEAGGYTVVTATSGVEGVAFLDGHDGFEGLVTDIKLPQGPNGWEVARHAREINADIAVVYVTGDSVDDWHSQGVPDSLVLQKPFAEAQLVTAISQLITEAGTRP